MSIFASFLDGNQREQKFYLFTGCGSNSKSKLVELFQSCMRDYCVVLPVSLVTGKRSASNACSPELVATKGKRLAVMSEPSEGDTFNLGLVKEISGGDRIMARGLYQEPVEFRPQFKLVLLCNELPKVNSDNNGIWRRLRAVEFESTFIDAADQENISAEDNEFPLDLNLSSLMEHWKEHFLAFLVNVCYPRYISEGIIEPNPVKRSTAEYRCVSDHAAQYMSARIKVVDDVEMTITFEELLQDYRDWCKSERIETKNFHNRASFKKYMEKSMKNLIVKENNDKFLKFQQVCFRD